MVQQWLYEHIIMLCIDLYPYYGAYAAVLRYITYFHKQIGPIKSTNNKRHDDKMASASLHYPVWLPNGTSKSM